MSAYFHSYLCGRKAAEWLINMTIDTNTIITATEADQNLTRSPEIAERNDRAMACRQKLNIESSPMSELTEDAKIDIAAAQILERFRPAFEELAK